MQGGRAVPPADLEGWASDIELLIAGDEKAWSRALAVIERTVAALAADWALTTLDAEAVRDHVVDVLLMDGMRRLRGMRDPSRLGRYVRAISRNRAVHVAGHRISVAPLTERAGPVTAFVDLQGRSPPGGRDVSLTGIPAALLCFRRTLSLRQFQVLWLYHVEGFSMSRIAAVCKITRQAVGKAHAAAVMAIRALRATSPERPRTR